MYCLHFVLIAIFLFWGIKRPTLIDYFDYFTSKNIVMYSLVKFVSICRFIISNFRNFYLKIIIESKG